MPTFLNSQAKTQVTVMQSLPLKVASRTPNIRMTSRLVRLPFHRPARLCEDSIDPEEHVALQDALTALKVLLRRKERAEGDGEKGRYRVDLRPYGRSSSSGRDLSQTSFTRAVKYI
jgi:hypothetical protein